MNRLGALFLAVAVIIFGAFVIAGVAQNGNYVRHTEIRQTVMTTVDGETTVRTSTATDSWLAAPFHSERIYVREGHSYKFVTDQVLLREWYTPALPFLKFSPPKSDQ